MIDFSWIIEAVNATNATLSAGDVFSVALSNPRVAVAIGIEVILGAALGYLMAKMAKYILAFIALLVVGAILNLWSLGESIEEFLMRIGTTAAELKDVILGFINMLGLLMVGPVTLGFFIGLIIGMLKK